MFSITDFKVLLVVYKKFKQGDKEIKLTRKELVEKCGVSHSALSRRIRNLYLKENEIKG